MVKPFRIRNHYGFYFFFLWMCLLVIPPCLKSELAHFPLRMRDWLKNVLLQLYEQDFLTDKQRSKVCIHEQPTKTPTITNTKF